ncbi:MAG: 50S ribosomal protein L24 [Candidatus Nealsonbacteria bacterium DGGOD1a]|jgi:large subunit ribosomal protein L24|nr:MAG: 50S ribosomal protein L24 [Candidatus Nealsonbacteria bacterium DGGOD1a]
MKIIKGDNVLVISGKDRAKTGKVLTALPKNGRIVVEGVNIAKKSQKPRQQGQKGQIVSLPKSIDASNVKLICPKCGKAARVGYKVIEGGENGGKKTVRICRKCLAEI